MFGSLKRAVTGFMGMRYFLIANICFLQVRGIPIGGPLSGVVLRLVLSLLQWKSDRLWKRRHRLVYCGRYVDDIVLISNRLCHACLALRVQHVYGQVIHFSIEPPPPVVLNCAVSQYLEAELHISFTGTRVWVHHKNMEFAIVGPPSRPTKQSFPPYMGTFTKEDLVRHRSELKGRIHRWESLQVEDINLLDCFCLDMLFYFRLGYPGRIVRYTWQAMYPPSAKRDLIHL